jgi:hypothetical protein
VADERKEAARLVTADEIDQRVVRLASILYDLDRCEHGRHEGDVCSGCRGRSLGNPFLQVIRHGSGRPPFAQLHAEERQIGFDISGSPIFVPARADAHRPEAWAPGPDASGSGEVSRG